MKTDGVNVETSQITTAGSLLKLVTVALIAAIRVVQLVIGRDGSTGQKLTDVIADPVEVPALQAIHTTLEGRTQKLKNPHDPTSLAWYAWIAARLVRLHLQGLQAAGTQDHGARPEKTRCHDRRLLAGKSFRTYRTLVARSSGRDLRRSSTHADRAPCHTGSPRSCRTASGSAPRCGRHRSRSARP